MAAAGTTIVTWEHDTLEFSITDMEITSASTPVPEPATMPSSRYRLAGLAGARKRFKTPDRIRPVYAL